MGEFFIFLGGLTILFVKWLVDQLKEAKADDFAIKHRIDLRGTEYIKYKHMDDRTLSETYERVENKEPQKKFSYSSRKNCIIEIMAVDGILATNDFSNPIVQEYYRICRGDKK